MPEITITCSTPLGPVSVTRRSEEVLTNTQECAIVRQLMGIVFEETEFIAQRLYPFDAGKGDYDDKA